jgi:hypothetical protein
VPPDDKRPKRVQTATERDLRSPHLGMQPAPGEIEALADESDSDGTPTVKLGPDQAITPKPHHVMHDPVANACWDHSSSIETRAANRASLLNDSFLGSTEARKKLDEVAKTQAEHTGFIGKVKLIGAIATLVIGATFALAIKALYGAGLDTGTVNTQLIYMQRQIDANERLIESNNLDLKRLLEKLDDKIDEHARYHNSRGSRSTQPAPTPGPIGDPP